MDFGVVLLLLMWLIMLVTLLCFAVLSTIGEMLSSGTSKLALTAPRRGASF
jgi:hypothetical protein